MKYTHRIQVLFTDNQYEVLEDLAAKTRKKLGTLVREAVEEMYLKQEKINRTKDAIDSLLKIAAESPAPPPENWETWEKEYARLKSGHTR